MGRVDHLDEVARLSGNVWRRLPSPISTFQRICSYGEQDPSKWAAKALPDQGGN